MRAIVAITGSVGKTGTKEAMRLAFARQGRVHASVASYNNHWGVPLTLARTPRDTRFGIFEIGMNHAGEILPLTAMVRPHVAIVTTIEPVHIEFFPSIWGIADAKGEIFSGLEPGGVAIVPRDSFAFERLKAHALASSAGRVITFGEHEAADVRAVRIIAKADGSIVDAVAFGRPITYRIGTPGRHIALNSLSVLAAAHAVGADLGAAAQALADLRPPVGRGERTLLSVGGGGVLLIDESYNANPASMRAALANLGAAEPAHGARRIAVLGDMRELGEAGPGLHVGLTEAVRDNNVDLVFAAGSLMGQSGRQPAGVADRSPCGACGGPRRGRLRDDPTGGCRDGEGFAQHADGPRREGAQGTIRRGRSREDIDMLTFLADLSPYFTPLNVFRYITFRTGAATATGLLFVFLFGPWMISLLRLRQGKGQPIREDGPQSHLTKRGTPTMGGLMIMAGVLVSTLLWANLENLYVWVVLMVTVGFGAIGFYDDYLKVTKQSHKGFSGKSRLAIEALIAALACIAIAYISAPGLSNRLALPFSKELLFNVGWFYVVFAGFVIVGAGNAVNITDGLDGLAIVPVMIAAGTFGFIAYLSGNAVFSNYLQIHFVPGTGELAVVCGALMGAGLGFLWFNAPPAQIFMGDTGSLALGGLLGTIAVATKHEVVLAIVGGLFVLEILSVVIQVTSFKLTGRRVFKMAPIHHHFEQLGWTEPQVVIRFWIIAVVLAILGLATLKLR